MTENLSPIVLSLQCALISAFLNLPWGIFWGWFLARKQFRGKLILQTLLYVPLVLPPVLTGYFLLVLFSRNYPLGQWLWETFGIHFVLDWKGAAVAAAVVSSPFMIQLVKESVAKVDRRLELVARSLGVGRWKVFWTVTVPLAWPGIVAGFFLVFARSIGEFGATIMVAGNIPGKTQTIPLAIYSKFYLGQDASIVPLIVVSILLAYAGLMISQIYNRQDAHEDQI